jgi:hypothetical protein
VSPSDAADITSEFSLRGDVRATGAPTSAENLPRLIENFSNVVLAFWKSSKLAFLEEFKPGHSRSVQNSSFLEKLKIPRANLIPRRA